MEQIRRIMRPTDVPDTGSSFWGKRGNGFVPSGRVGGGLACCCYGHSEELRCALRWGPVHFSGSLLVLLFPRRSTYDIDHPIRQKGMARGTRWNILIFIFYPVMPFLSQLNSLWSFKGFCVICYGQILTRTCKDGAGMIAAFPSLLGRMS